MLKVFYRCFGLFLIITITFAANPVPARAVAWRDKVDPWILQTAAEGETEFLVYLTTQADLSSAGRLSTRLEKGTYVFQTLAATAERTQSQLIAYLQALGLAYHPFWIANMIWVRGDLSTVQLLASRPDVEHLYANPTVALDDPVGVPSPSPAPLGIEWNITKVNAPQVWALGYTGQGVVIGGQDTGYAWSHPAIKNQYRGWDGQNVDHDYNWFDATANPSPTPIDPYGHGTHTMGTMVGDDGANNKIGMAPGAHWIGCRNMDSGGNGTPATYTACYQWFVAPTRVDGTDPRTDLAPDVINNSWGCPPSEGCTDPNVLLTVVQNLVAAGIVTAHSAGNSGSNPPYICSTIEDPAAIYDESFTVGATNSSDGIASFSSIGPVIIDDSHRSKPDISAPGVNVRSCIPGGGYSSLSGTSMAAPHVAGLVALLISANPGLRGQVDQIESIIEQSANHISWSGCESSGVPNNVYGWGRIDALAAVQFVHTLALGKNASASSVMPGDVITYTLTITHATGVGATTGVILTDSLPAGTAFVAASSPFTRSGATIQWDIPALGVQESRNVDLAVRVVITATGEITNVDYAVRSDQVAQVYGAPVTTLLGQLDLLELSKTASFDAVYPGELITYTLAITNNNGLIAAPNVVLTDTLPVSTSFVSATEPFAQVGNSIRWDIPSLAANSSRLVQLVVKTDLAAFGTITNDDYAARSDLDDPVRGSPVATRLEKIEMLVLNMMDSPSFVFPGELLTYVVVIKNDHDTLAATNLVLTDTLPVGTSFISTTHPYTRDGDVIRWDIPSLLAHQSLNILLVVRVNRSAFGSIANFDYGVYSDQAAFTRGVVVTTPLGSLFFLPFAIKSP